MSPMTEAVELRVINLPLTSPFRTSFGVEHERACILVTVYSEGLNGWGECVASRHFGYAYETLNVAWEVIHDFLGPAVLGEDATNTDALRRAARRLRGYPMSVAALEAALLDLRGRQTNQSMADLLAGDRGHTGRIPVGVSIGMQESVQITLDLIAGFLQDGYQRIKLKIQPGWDYELAVAARRAFPDTSIMLDANSAYTLDDAPLFQSLDELDLLMIEQPLAHDDIYEHSLLQKQIQTRICLDESIHNLSDTYCALELGAARIINIKPARVGGLTTAVAIHDVCHQRKVPVWCGGMLETGIGRAANIALASLPGFVLPGDISASNRYYRRDVIDPPVTLNADGALDVPTDPGLGVNIDEQFIESITEKRAVLRVE